MSKIVAASIEQEGATLGDENHIIVNEIFNKTPYTFAEDTPQFLLWQQQKEEASKKDSRGMRWHPLIIRLCLSIYHTSPAAYKQLANRKINFLRLPHVNTLNKYSNFTQPQTGFNPDILKELVLDAGLEKLPEYKKNVVICYDEMKIKFNLVYSRTSGKMVGFTEMGNINDEFKTFQEKLEREQSAEKLDRELASHVIVYMVRGIFSNLSYPFAFFASTGFTASQLYPCTIEATKVLTCLGFHVRAYVSDGASPNRKFYKIISPEDEVYYWTWNIFETGQKIYLFSDVPHLLKTTRNCLENSFWNKLTRNMHVSLIIYFF